MTENRDEVVSGKDHPVVVYATTMVAQVLESLGLARNEAKILETLLREGELSVGRIAVKSRVHRRNVYDSMRRLLERGLVFEIIGSVETRYQAVDPDKLRELIQEKETLLVSVLPQLRQWYAGKPPSEAVYLYRGIEGWKNYMRDILRVGEDFYCIGAKGGWLDKRLTAFFPQFIKEARRKRIAMYHLFDHEVKAANHEILKYAGKNHRFLPAEYSTPACVDVFGDRVNMISSIHLGGVGEDFSFAVIVNERVADAFRIWFRFMYEMCSERRGVGKRSLSMT